VHLEQRIQELEQEICFLAGALASRAITDLVVGRKTNVLELDIFSRP
jgi:hypothetical protein